MKKIGYLLAVLGILSCIFLVGLHQKKQKETDASRVAGRDDTEMITTGVENTEVADAGAENDGPENTGEEEFSPFPVDEKEFNEQLKKETAEAEKGNIHTVSDGRRSFGGFGIEVKYFQIFDSIEAFQASERYVADYQAFTPGAPEEQEFMEIVYIEYEVTNEKQAKAPFYPQNLSAVYVNKEGDTYDVNKGIDPYGEAVKGIYNEVFYSTLVENPVDEKDDNAPVIPKGDTVSLQAAFVCIAGDSEEEVLMKPSDLFDSGAWYFAVPGLGAIGSGNDYNIYKDKGHMFIKLE